MMKKAFFLLVCCILTKEILGVAIEVDLPVEHSLGEGKFSKAGKIYGTLETDAGIAGSLTFLRSDLSSAEQAKLKELVQSDKLYQLRISADPRGQRNQTIMTSVPARCLLEGNSLVDHLVVHATKQGDFTGLNHDFSSHPCRSSKGDITVPSGLEFSESSVVQIWLPAIVPVLTKSEPLPGDQKGLKTKATRKPVSGQSGKEGEGEEEEVAPDTRPWIVKNWMIAVPLGLVAFNVLTAVMAPADTQGQAPAGARRR